MLLLLFSFFTNSKFGKLLRSIDLSSLPIDVLSCFMLYLHMVPRRTGGCLCSMPRGGSQNNSSAPSTCSKRLYQYRSHLSEYLNMLNAKLLYFQLSSRFHKFGRKLQIETLRTRIPQKKVTSTRSAKTKRNRFTFNEVPDSPRLCQPCTEVAPITPEQPASPEAPVFLYDINVPGVPYQPPTANPTNCELARLRQYQESLAPVQIEV